MSQVSSSTMTWVQDNSRQHQLYGYEPWNQQNSFPTAHPQMTMGTCLWQSQPWRQPQWGFLEHPQPRTQASIAQESPFHRKLKEMQQSQLSLSSLTQPRGHKSTSRSSSPRRHFHSSREKQKTLHEGSSTVSRPSSSGHRSKLDRVSSGSSIRALPSSFYREFPEDFKHPITRLRDQQSRPASRVSSSKSFEVSSPAADGSKTKTCVACTDDFAMENFPESPQTRSCSHPNSACKACIKQWIESRIAEGSWENIKCLECDETMQYADVQLHADVQTFQKYDMLSARSWLNNEQDFVWCRNQGCGSGQLHVGGHETPMFRCVACQSQYCIVHEVPWHQGESCADFDRRMNGESTVPEPVSVTSRPPSPPRYQRLYTHGILPSMSAEGNKRQERKLYDEARSRRAMASNTRNTDYIDEVLAMEDDINHAWSNTVPSTDAWGRRMQPSYMPQPSREWAPQVSAARAAMPPSPTPSTHRRRSIYDRFYNKGTSVYPNSAPVDWYPDPRTTFLHDQAYDRNIPPQPSRDEDFARDLQRRYDKENNVGRKDATAARELQSKYDREESKRQEREAYQRRKAEEKQGEETVKANAKQCPKCRWFIQKNNGCDHMTCWKCKHEFCWLCLVDYQRIRDDGNSAHKSSCRDYRRV